MADHVVTGRGWWMMRDPHTRMYLMDITTLSITTPGRGGTPYCAQSMILEIAGQRVDLSLGAGRWQAQCPFHADTEQEFHLNASGYHCRACGVQGDLRTLLTLLRDRDRPLALNMIARLLSDTVHDNAGWSGRTGAENGNDDVSRAYDARTSEYRSSFGRQSASVVSGHLCPDGRSDTAAPASALPMLADVIRRYPVAVVADGTAATWAALEHELLASLERDPGQAANQSFIDWYCLLAKASPALFARIKLGMRDHRIALPQSFDDRVRDSGLREQREALRSADRRDEKVKIAEALHGVHVTPLGHNTDTYYFASGANLQLVEIKGAALSRSTSLYRLAPRAWWMTAFGTERGLDCDAAVAWLMEKCQARGIYSHSEVVRGIGTWLDEGRVIQHFGSLLMVDGVATDVRGYSDSMYFYEGAKSLVPAGLRGRNEMERVGQLTPLSDAEGHQIIDAAERFAWADPRMAILAAGWVAASILCAALPWRSHIWLTAPAASGKTVLVEKFVRGLLAGYGLHYVGGTSEAGIRQILKTACLPVLLDEVEGETMADAARVRQILVAMRSMTGDGQVAKGSAGGEAISFAARSMILLSSIAHDLTQAADQSRTINLRLLKLSGEEETRQKPAWDEQASIMRNWDDEFRIRFWLRMASLLPTILTNITTLEPIIAEAAGEGRAGKLFAPVLAAHHALTSRDVLSQEQAEGYVARMGALIRDCGGGEDKVPDGQQALDFLGCQQIEVEQERIIVAEAVSRAVISPDGAASQALRRMGLRIMPSVPLKPRRLDADPVKGDWLAVWTSSPVLHSLFADSRWSGARWREVIRQLPDVMTHNVRFLGKDPMFSLMVPLDRVRALSVNEVRNHDNADRDDDLVQELELQQE
jgi:putative DNA primase/helicase